MKAIADTGFLVAFGNRKDQHHSWARQLAGRVTEPLLTCDAVLAETAFHLGNSALALAFVTHGLVRPALVLGDHLPRLIECRHHHRFRGFPRLPARPPGSDSTHSPSELKEDSN